MHTTGLSCGGFTGEIISYLLLFRHQKFRYMVYIEHVHFNSFFKN